MGNPSTVEQQSVGMNGTNDLDQNDVPGINTKSNNTADVQGLNSPEKQDRKGKSDNKVIIKDASSTSDAIKTYSYHKRKPKPTGKHHRPVPPSDPPVTDSSTPKKPEFVTQEFGILKRKKKRKLTCPMCKHPSYSQAEANHHYKTNHPPLKFSKCDQLFNNPCSLRRHFYSHTKEEPHTCRNCGCNFACESDLSAHRLKYCRHPRFMCNHDINGKVCGKWFFAKSDLTKHALIHSGKIHRCMECDFTMLDKRYLKAHIYTHSDHMQYSCSNCGEQFKHHTQLISHRVKCT